MIASIIPNQSQRNACDCRWRMGTRRAESMVSGVIIRAKRTVRQVKLA